MSARRLLVDTNLLVLLAVGTASPSFIGAHKRTRAYTSVDHDLLLALVSESGGLATTPNILTETSNLIRQFAMPGRKAILAAFRAIVAGATERFVPSLDAVHLPEFFRIGLADSAAILAQDGDMILLTDDLELYLASLAAGRRAVNFQHERQRRSN